MKTKASKLSAKSKRSVKTMTSGQRAWATRLERYGKTGYKPSTQSAGKAAAKPVRRARSLSSGERAWETRKQNMIAAGLMNADGTWTTKGLRKFRKIARKTWATRRDLHGETGRKPARVGQAVGVPSVMAAVENHASM